MTYRDDGDALRARMERLEGQLADAQATIGRLRGETESAETRVVDGALHWMTGTPKETEIVRTFPFALGDAGVEAVAAVLMRELQGGQVSQVGRVLYARRPPVEITLRRDDSQTVLRLKRTWNPVGGVVASVFGSIAAVTLPALGIGMDAGMPWIPAVVVPVTAVLAAALSRLFQRRSVRRHRQQHRTEIEALAALIEEHAPKPRLEDTPADEVEVPVQPEEATRRRAE